MKNEGLPSLNPDLLTVYTRLLGENKRFLHHPDLNCSFSGDLILLEMEGSAFWTNMLNAHKVLHAGSIYPPFNRSVETHRLFLFHWLNDILELCKNNIGNIAAVNVFSKDFDGVMRGTEYLDELVLPFSSASLLDITHLYHPAIGIVYPTYNFEFGLGGLHGINHPSAYQEQTHLKTLLIDFSGNI